MKQPFSNRRFEELALPHLDAAFNLARVLTRNDADAEDVVQDAYVRAYRFFDGFRGGDPRPWLLAIVRNACFTWLRSNRQAELVDGYHENESIESDYVLGAQSAANPEVLLLKSLDRTMLNVAIDALPAVFREVLMLRELDGCAYRDIARIIDAPIGTVMSRLARARRLLRQSLQVVVTASESKAQK